MGLFDEIAALAPAALTAARLTSPRGRTLHTELPGVAWGVSRYALDAALAQAAVQRGAELRTGVTVTACTPAAGGFNLQVRSREISSAGPATVAARAVIMACGRHSVAGLPPRTTVDAGSARRKQVGVKCHYAAVQMPAQVELFFFRGGYAGINPVEGGRANLCLLASYAAFAAAGRSVASMLAAAATWNPALAARLQGAEPLVETECAVAPVDTHRPAQPWDGVACLGDTAAMIPPLCGDGMAMALRGAELCAPLVNDFLRGQLTLAAWAQAHRRVWQVEFQRRLRMGRALQSVLETPWGAEALIGLGALIPSLANYFVRSTRGPVSPALAVGPDSLRG
jgi:flavin-dependent dehydrogenase